MADARERIRDTHFTHSSEVKRPIGSENVACIRVTSISIHTSTWQVLLYMIQWKHPINEYSPMIHTFKITQRNGDEHTVYVDEQDRALVEQHIWRVNSSGYAATDVCTQTVPRQSYVLLHRLLMNPGELHIDHINRNRLDNRRCNLRVCTQTQNNRNRCKQVNNTSGYRGVVQYRGKYTVRISLNGTDTYHGYYTSKHSAAIVANIKRRELHGDYSVGDCVGNLHALYYPELVH